MTDRERAYAKKLNELLKKTGRLEDREVKKVLAMLEQARVEIGARVAGTEWQAYRIGEMTRAVDEAVADLKRQYGQSQGEALANMWEAGQDMVSAPLAAAQFSAPVTQLSRTTLEIMQGYSADLVGGLTEDLRRKVNNEIIQGVMGGKPLHEVMRAIGLNLKEAGIMKGVGARAEAISRTEMARVHSLAREARMRAVMAGTPGIGWQKKWISSGKAHPRPVHASLNGTKVPVDEKFAGRIDYPHAPGSPASEVVNCGCTHVLVTDWDALPVVDGAIYHERAIYD